MSRSRGFTLLEVLVALALTGLLVVLLFSGFRVGVRSWQLAQRHTAEVEEGRQLAALFYRHFNQLQMPAPAAEAGPLPPGARGRRPEPLFLGEAGRIRYVAPLSLSAGSRLYLIEFTDNPEGRGGIWVRMAPFRADAEPAQLLATAELTRVSADLHIAFAYFGDPDEGWQSDYRRLEPPRLVVVKLSSDDRDWPSITYAVTATVPMAEGEFFP